VVMNRSGLQKAVASARSSGADDYSREQEMMERFSTGAGAGPGGATSSDHNSTHSSDYNPTLTNHHSTIGFHPAKAHRRRSHRDKKKREAAAEQHSNDRSWFGRTKASGRPSGTARHGHMFIYNWNPLKFCTVHFFLMEFGLFGSTSLRDLQFRAQHCPLPKPGHLCPSTPDLAKKMHKMYCPSGCYEVARKDVLKSLVPPLGFMMLSLIFVYLRAMKRGESHSGVLGRVMPCLTYLSESEILMTLAGFFLSDVGMAYSALSPGTTDLIRDAQSLLITFTIIVSVLGSCEISEHAHGYVIEKERQLLLEAPEAASHLHEIESHAEEQILETQATFSVVRYALSLCFAAVQYAKNYPIDYDLVCCDSIFNMPDLVDVRDIKGNTYQVAMSEVMRIALAGGTVQMKSNASGTISAGSAARANAGKAQDVGGMGEQLMTVFEDNCVCTLSETADWVLLLCSLYIVTIASSCFLHFFRAKVLALFVKNFIRMDMMRIIIDKHEAETHGVEYLELSSTSRLKTWVHLRKYLQDELMPLDYQLSQYGIDGELILIVISLALFVYLGFTVGWINWFTFSGGAWIFCMLFTFLGTLEMGKRAFVVQKEHDDALATQKMWMQMRDRAMSCQGILNEPEKTKFNIQIFDAKDGGGPINCIIHGASDEQKLIRESIKMFGDVQEMTDRSICWVWIVGFRLTEELSNLIRGYIFTMALFAASHISTV